MVSACSFKDSARDLKAYGTPTWTGGLLGLTICSQAVPEVLMLGLLPRRKKQISGMGGPTAAFFSVTRPPEM